ncbi:hypothetical protein [Paenibacillus piri]|uniref:hypothetical protein n=1 Tax=Paenibacillus piri TaxID=2547395 RepID=UPI0014055B1B|nr:hypothetical protein [Paenibacillus piri]
MPNENKNGTNTPESEAQEPDAQAQTDRTTQPNAENGIDLMRAYSMQLNGEMLDEDSGP